jgi:glutaconyl-CoA decarboxylase
MPGSIFNIPVTVGQAVTTGETVIVLEAMKMEIEVVAETSGTVKQILVSKGASVNTGDILVVIN